MNKTNAVIITKDKIVISKCLDCWNWQKKICIFILYFPEIKNLIEGRESTKSNWKNMQAIIIMLEINWTKTNELYTSADSKNKLKKGKYFENVIKIEIEKNRMKKIKLKKCSLTLWPKCENEWAHKDFVVNCKFHQVVPVYALNVETFDKMLDGVYIRKQTAITSIHLQMHMLQHEVYQR